MAHAWIFPPLAEENVHAVLLKMKQEEHEDVVEEHKMEGEKDWRRVYKLVIVILNRRQSAEAHKFYILWSRWLYKPT